MGIIPTIIIAVLVIAFLVIVHEFGHFIVAKLSGMRVDEFGIGFPPRIWAKKVGETEYSINWIPLGGFVRIFGENPDEVAGSPDGNRSINAKPRILQAAVVVAGVTFNMILAVALFVVICMIGVPEGVDTLVTNNAAQHATVRISEIATSSPAEAAGLAVGDRITKLSTGNDTLLRMTPGDLAAFVGTHASSTLAVSYIAPDGSSHTADIQPATNVTPDHRAVIGIGMDPFTMSFGSALVEGPQLTGAITVQTWQALGGLVSSFAKGHPDLQNVAGPVGIVQLVGVSASLGLSYLLLIMAAISVNLAIVNVIPFPVLDGGRLLFIIIEAIKQRPIDPRSRIAMAANYTGLAILLILVVVITWHDIVRLATGG